MIRIVLKGTVAQTNAALRARGIRNAQVMSHNARYNETIWRVASDNEPRVVAWFAESPHGAPYPVGTMLFYTWPERV